MVWTFFSMIAITSGTNAHARVILYAFSTIANILASSCSYLYATNAMMMKKKPTTVARVMVSAFLSERAGSHGRMMFSMKSADGARSVPEAVDMIAERRAQKKRTCMKSGVAERISAGRTRWESSVFVTSSGATIHAAYPSMIGRKAITI